MMWYLHLEGVMSDTVAVHLTEDEIAYMIDAMDEQARHWELCGGSDEENARYQATLAAYRRIGRKLEESLEAPSH